MKRNHSHSNGIDSGNRLDMESPRMKVDGEYVGVTFQNGIDTPESSSKRPDSRGGGASVSAGGLGQGIDNYSFLQLEREQAQKVAFADMGRLNRQNSDRSMVSRTGDSNAASMAMAQNDSGAAAGSGSSSTSARSGRSERLLEGSSLFGVMEVLYDKLETLRRLSASRLGCIPTQSTIKPSYGEIIAPDGDQRGTEIFYCPPLLRFHFICDLGLLGLGRASGDTAGAGQYRKMVAVAVWLAELCRPGLTPLGSTVNVESDSPISVAKRILKEAEVCGVDRNTLGTVGAPSLAKGYGEGVIALLSGMADEALNACKHKWQPLKYSDADDIEINNDEIEETEEDLEDTMGSVDQANMIEEVYYHNQQSVSEGDGSNIDCSTRRIDLDSNSVDARLWVEEAERVGPQLVAATASRPLLGEGWSGHTEALSRLGKKVRGYMDGYGGDDNQSIGLSLPLPLLGSSLSQLQRSLDSELDRVNRGESLLNTAESERKEGYSLLTKELCNLQKRHNDQTVLLEKKGDLLADLIQRVDEAGAALEARTGESPNGGGVGTTIRYKDAIRRLREDIQEIDLRIGLVANQLLHKQRKRGHDLRTKRQTARREAKQRLERASGNQEDHEAWDV